MRLRARPADLVLGEKSESTLKHGFGYDEATVAPYREVFIREAEPIEQLLIWRSLAFTVDRGEYSGKLFSVGRQADYMGYTFVVLSISNEKGIDALVEKERGVKIRKRFSIQLAKI